MYLSLERQFLFVHIPKTAGSSIREAVAPYCVQRNRTPWRRVSSYLPLREDPHRAYLRGHDTAAQARRKLGGDLFDRLYRFAVVRNPYDLAVSYFAFLKKHPHLKRHKQAVSLSFEDFLRRWARGQRRDQSRFVEDRAGRMIVPHILHFETLAQDLERTGRDIGVDFGAVRRVNASDRGDYRSYYTPGARALVERLFARDLAHWEYDFDTGQAGASGRSALPTMGV
ncbi:MAG: sulfotransferase family 2 domain-containing protein [Pseudomonadota bacterium]